MAQSSRSKKRRLSKVQRRLLLAGIAVLTLLALAGGFHLFQSWRARDLAHKALDNYEQANYRMAWLQVRSARALRAEDPEVLRSSAIIESGLGQPSGLDFWNRLAESNTMSAEDLLARAKAAARFGSDGQFEAALKDLAAAGDPAEVGRLRAARKLARGEVDDAIDEVRRMVDESNDPLMKLDLARLLVRRHVDRLASSSDPSEQRRRVAEEIAGLINSVQGTPAQEQALAVGLIFVRPDPAERGRWAALAMENLQSDNPALLPAATTQVELGTAKPEDLHRQLRPIFDAAPLDRRAAFADWLTGQGLPREGLSLITAQESAESTEAFRARVAALAAMENWTALLETADVNGNAPEWLRLVAKARAEFGLGRGAQSGAKSVADAMGKAARAGTLSGGMIAEFDQMGASAAVDASLIDMCGDPQFGDKVFRMTRDRLSRRGDAGAEALASAHQRATAVAPNGSAVVAYARYLRLMDDIGKNGLLPAGQPAPDKLVVDPADTAKSVQDAPADETVRATHALALIQAGRGTESFGVFDDITIFFNRLPPPMRAVLAAAAAASGEPGLAVEMERKTPVAALTPAEVRLLPSGILR
jgi:hypothetical protein